NVKSENLFGRLASAVGLHEFHQFGSFGTVLGHIVIMSSEELLSVDYEVFGRVQGEFFRKYTQAVQVSLLLKLRKMVPGIFRKERQSCYPVLLCFGFGRSSQIRMDNMLAFDRRLSEA
ncbi:putative acylphosphatase-1, partial [Triplophysa rosa]